MEVNAETERTTYGKWKISMVTQVEKSITHEEDGTMLSIPILFIETTITKLLDMFGQPVSDAIALIGPSPGEMDAFWNAAKKQVIAKNTIEMWEREEPWKDLIWNPNNLPREHIESLERYFPVSGWIGTTPEAPLRRNRREVTEDMTIREMNLMIGHTNADYEIMLHERMVAIQAGVLPENHPLPDRKDCVIIQLIVESMESMSRIGKSVPTIEIHNNDNDNDDSKPAAKKRRENNFNGLENQLEEGSVEEAKGFASGSSAGKSSA
jgi:hypothetical protein